MQQTQRPVPRRSLRTRGAALLLAIALVLGLIPGFSGVSETASAHWADPYLSQLVEWGFIRSDQAENPDSYLTRADFMSIVNRAYGYTQGGPTPFDDVEESDWFYDDVGIAYNAQYIYGTSPTTVSPNDTLTRETAATILGRNMMLKESEGEILDFSDARDISPWARGTIKSSLEHYLVGGYDDGTFKPQKDLSWGEMAAMLSRIVGTPLQESGDYSMGGVFGNVTISSPGVTLRDTIISGDLYVTGGVGLGDVKLENVTVLGRIIASGTGESEGGRSSITLRNVVADELLVDNLQDHFVTIQADGITEIGQVTVRTDAYLEDNTPEGLGLKSISLEGEEGTLLDLAGRIESVAVKTPGAQGLHNGKGQHRAGQTKNIVGISPVPPPQLGGVHHLPQLVGEQIAGPAHNALQVVPLVQGDELDKPGQNGVRVALSADKPVVGHQRQREQVALRLHQDVPQQGDKIPLHVP